MKLESGSGLHLVLCETFDYYIAESTSFHNILLWVFFHLQADPICAFFFHG